MDNKNAYIKINGKEYEIPERLTFGQMLELEQNGLKVVDLEKSNFFGDIVKVIKVISHCKENDIIKAVEDYVNDGNSIDVLLTACYNSITAFFTKNRKN